MLDKKKINLLDFCFVVFCFKDFTARRKRRDTYLSLAFERHRPRAPCSFTSGLKHESQIFVFGQRSNAFHDKLSKF